VNDDARGDPMLNAIMRTLLRSPLHGLASKGMMLLTVTGRTSGRSYTFPVQYVADGGTLIVLPGRANTKTWWRNLQVPAPVRMRIRGRDVGGIAVAIVDPQDVAEGLRTYVRRFPRSAKSLGVAVLEPGGELDPSALARAATENVVVRIDLG